MKCYEQIDNMKFFENGCQTFEVLMGKSSYGTSMRKSKDENPRLGIRLMSPAHSSVWLRQIQVRHQPATWYNVIHIKKITCIVVCLRETTSQQEFHRTTNPKAMPQNISKVCGLPYWHEEWEEILLQRDLSVARWSMVCEWGSWWDIRGDFTKPCASRGHRRGHWDLERGRLPLLADFHTVRKCVERVPRGTHGTWCWNIGRLCERAQCDAISVISVHSSFLLFLAFFRAAGSILYFSPFIL